MPDQLSTQPVARNDAELIASLSAQLEAQAALICEQAASLAFSRKTFDRASAAARIGVWQCNLADESLVWTDVVYDLFDLPRGSVPDRKQTLACYPEDSARELHRRRSKAIAECSGFDLDAEIITVKGNRRWIRITASVECEDGIAVRIFGMKQDITEEKILADRTRYLAEFDAMTGLANRSQFQLKLSTLSNASNHETKPLGALLLIDLDEFKSVNDSFGHAAGDESLRETAQRLRSVCSDAELVARIGGDEFAVLLGAHLGLEEISEIARAIIREMAKPIVHHGRSFKLGASVGIAQVGDSAPSQLFMEADAALYAAKDAGRNTFRIFTPSSDKRSCGSSVAA